LQHTFGYACVSATDQNLDTQLEDLPRVGCSRIFQEKVSGTRTRSLALDELLSAVREGDVVVVNRLARLGRNTVHTIQLVEEFNRRGVHFRALDLGIDSRTPADKLIIGVFSSSNQYERENNREKSLAGIELAKQQGKCMAPEDNGVTLGSSFRVNLWEKYHPTAPAQRWQLGALSSKVQKAYKR